MSNWFQASFQNVAAAEGVSVDLVEGYYTATIVSAEPEVSQNGRNQVVFRLQVTTHGFEGAIRHNRLGVPQSQDDKVLMFWRAALLSAGYTAAQIDSGPVTLSSELFVGKTVYFYYKPGNKEAGVYEKLLFVSPETFAEKSKAHTQASSAAAGSANAGGLGGGLGGAGLGGGLGAANPMGGGLGGGLGAAPAGGLNGGLGASNPAAALMGMIGKKPANA